MTSGVGPDGLVWSTAHRHGARGRLDPAPGRVAVSPLGTGSARHGVIIGPDGARRVTDDGAADAIDWVDRATGAVTPWPVPEARGWVHLATPPDGAVNLASLAGHHFGRITVETGAATVIELPTRDQDARRGWSDSRGVARFASRTWAPGQGARLVRLPRPGLGPRGPLGPARPGGPIHRGVEGVAAPGDAAPRLGRHRPPDPGPPRRGPGARVGDRPAGGLPLAMSRRVGASAAPPLAWIGRP
jgi:hypothetical protein